MCRIESADAISIQQKNFFILRYGYEFEQFQLDVLFLFLLNIGDRVFRMSGVIYGPVRTFPATDSILIVIQIYTDIKNCSCRNKCS